jgi:hypothetical protein
MHARVMAVAEMTAWRRATPQTPRKYSVCGADSRDMAAVGGAGMRTYFLIVQFLAVVFFVMTFMTLPALTSFYTGSMYDAKGAARIKTFWATLSMGNVVADHDSIKAGKAAGLMVASQTDALATLFFLLVRGKGRSCQHIRLPLCALVRQGPGHCIQVVAASCASMLLVARWLSSRRLRACNRLSSGCKGR